LCALNCVARLLPARADCCVAVLCRADCKLTVGSTVSKTFVVKKTLAPSWEEDFQITVQEPARQTLLVQVQQRAALFVACCPRLTLCCSRLVAQLFDQDRFGNDGTRTPMYLVVLISRPDLPTGKLGECSIPVSVVINAGAHGLVKQSYPLTGVAHGKVVLTLRFLALSIGSGGTLKAASASASALSLSRVASGGAGAGSS
jgi:hypothetical protein